jgi:trk system potassium uptake protein TrkH
VFLLIVLMLIGGGTCSTAGGIKQFRVYLVWKLFFWDIRRSIIPRKAVMECPIREGNRCIYLDDSRVRQVSVFIFLYLAIYVFGVMILSASGFSLRDALFEFASAIGTVGLSIGVTSAKMPDAAIWAETLAMFLGRLEFIVVIVSLIKLSRDCRLMMKMSPKRN